MKAQFVAEFEEGYHFSTFYMLDFRSVENKYFKGKKVNFATFFTPHGTPNNDKVKPMSTKHRD